MKLRMIPRKVTRMSRRSSNAIIVDENAFYEYDPKGTKAIVEILSSLKAFAVDGEFIELLEEQGEYK